MMVWAIEASTEGTIFLNIVKSLNKINVLLLFQYTLRPAVLLDISDIKEYSNRHDKRQFYKLTP